MYVHSGMHSFSIWNQYNSWQTGITTTFLHWKTCMGWEICPILRYACNNNSCTFLFDRTDLKKCSTLQGVEISLVKLLL